MEAKHSNPRNVCRILRWQLPRQHIVQIVGTDPDGAERVGVSRGMCGLVLRRLPRLAERSVFSAAVLNDVTPGAARPVAA